MGEQTTTAGPGRRQTQRHAEQAAERAREKREKQSGAAAWVAERAAGNWNLDGPDRSRHRPC